MRKGVYTMGGEPILVVDDEHDMRMALAHALSTSGYPVETAADGSEAIRRFEHEQFRMVITDMRMPEMSGMEVLRRVKRISPHVPVILITAYGTINSAVDAMKEGAADFILKPFSSEMLEEAVKKVGGGLNGTHEERKLEPQRLEGCEDRRIVTCDPEMIRMLAVAKNVAPSRATVLIQGESGTGKELLAAYIHEHGSRKEHPYIAVNCAALPETLAESELFGHERGSFTGAVRKKLGKFELANHGTLVLDEVSEMPLHLQAKLLRVLQEKEIDPVGGHRPVPLSIRIIAVTNRELRNVVKDGKFREDLYYRLNVIPLVIPPLRDRKNDIPLLAEHFLEKYSTRYGKEMKSIAEETISLLRKCDWRGNVRELENAIERAVLLANEKVLLPKHLFFEEMLSTSNESVSVKVGVSLRDMEREVIFKTLKEVGDNRTHAARLLGISIRTLRNKLREYRQEERVKNDRPG